MKIPLLYPYSEDYVSCYLNTRQSDGRQIVTLVDKGGKTTTTSHARYTMATRLGRYLWEHEEVDHKNEDRNDDYVYNLQVITQRENIDKHNQAKSEGHSPKPTNTKKYQCIDCGCQVSKKNCRCRSCTKLHSPSGKHVYQMPDKERLIEVYDQCSGNMSKMERELSIERRTIKRWLVELGLK